MSNSPSRNVVDQAVAGFIEAATRNMTNAPSNQIPSQQQQPSLHTQMGFAAAPYNINGMPNMPSNYASQFPQPPPFPQQQFNTNSQYANPYQSNWNQSRPPPRNGSKAYGICHTTGLKAEECNCQPPAWSVRDTHGRSRIRIRKHTG